jgi:hypothetical protein
MEMKNMKKIGLLSASSFALILTSCASLQGPGVADFNRDGVISDAEYNAYYKNKSIENINVNTERNKRMNAAGTIRDTRNTFWNARSIRNTIRNW